MIQESVNPLKGDLLNENTGVQNPLDAPTVNPMEEEEIIDESINDKNIFKVIILVGGAGAGKSYVVKKTFPNVKVLNADSIFEFKLDKNGLSHDIDPEAEDFPEKMALRKQAKHLNDKKGDNLLNSIIPLIIDGTGKDYQKVLAQKEKLEAIGYDVYLLFVNTTLDTTKRRNLKRKRSVPEAVVVDSWNQVQSNIGKFQELFSNNMFIVDNNDDSNVPDSVFNKIYNKTIESPLVNRIGLQNIEQLKQSGGKYLSDLNNEAE